MSEYAVLVLVIVLYILALNKPVFSNDADFAFWLYFKVDPWMSVSAAHRVGESVQQKLKECHPLLEEIFIHVGMFHGNTSNQTLILGLVNTKN